jgi:hypothetical protein
MAESDIQRLVTQIPSDNQGKIDRILTLTRWGHVEYQPWAAKVLKARRYYLGHQWDSMGRTMSKRRLKLVDNQIQPDIDKRVARMLEADPVMEASGRGTEDFEIGATWRDMVEYACNWTGTKHDSANSVRQQLWTALEVDGDVFEWITWDKAEEYGQGFVVSEMVSAMNVVWDDGVKSTQLRDAPWVSRFEPVDVEILEKRWERTDFTSDVPDLFTGAGTEQARLTNFQASTDGGSPLLGAAGRTRTKAYEITFLEKRPKARKTYMLEGITAKNRDADGNVVDMDEKRYNELPEARRKAYEEVEVEDYELWKTVVVNGKKVHDKISDDDASKKGHHEYPFARYSNTKNSEQTHARGDVEPLMGFQDVTNQTLSYGMERLFVDASTLLAIERGAQPRSEEAKLDRLGEQAVQKFYTHPGRQIPQVVQLGNPNMSSMFQQAHSWLSERRDRVSGVSDMQRGAPQYEMSGKAVRALLAEADLATTKVKKAIEDGLTQATSLQIMLMMQNLRVNRMLRIAPRAEKAGYKLFVTKSEGTTINEQKLTKPVGPEAPSDAMETPDGDLARVLEISDNTIRRFDLKLKLDTGRQRSRDERMDLVTQILNYVGPGAGVETLLVAIELMEVPNFDRWKDALLKEDEKTNIMNAVAQAQKETGMGLEEMKAAAMQMVAMMKGGGGAPAGPGAMPPAGPAGPPAPGGAPAGPGGPMAAPAPVTAPTDLSAELPGASQ